MHSGTELSEKLWRQIKFFARILDEAVFVSHWEINEYICPLHFSYRQTGFFSIDKAVNLKKNPQKLWTEKRQKWTIDQVFWQLFILNY